MLLFAFPLLLLVGPAANGEDRIAPIPVEAFDALHALILPQVDECPWREIDWHLSITQARILAAAQDKPIIIFTAADGSPLGRT
jgi:hypothetical protein